MTFAPRTQFHVEGVGAFSVLTNLRMELFQALLTTRTIFFSHRNLLPDWFQKEGTDFWQTLTL